MKNKKQTTGVLTQVKYSISIGLTLFAYLTTKDPLYIGVSLLELGVIICISNVLVSKFKFLGVLINDFLCLLYNTQQMVLFFGNGFIQLIMLSNVASLKDLEGKVIQYCLGAGIILLISLLPITSFKNSKKKKLKYFSAAVLFVAVDALVISLVGGSYSPSVAYYNLAYDEYSMMHMRNQVPENIKKIHIDNVNPTIESFYKEEVTDYRRKERQLSSRPNVILIFTEGLSQHIIDDSRNIMPNVRNFQNKALSFKNYYNHTFATYRGLIGQMYSGYQLDNLDENKLVSLEDVFKEYEYHTTLVNTEPFNQDYTDYLKRFEFDEMLGSQDDKMKGYAETYSDKQAYEMMYDKALSLNKEEDPFFLCMYTIGTHVTFDSPDEKFGNGKDSVLNRFYNADYQFGKFLEEFENSELADNTIIVFTADHCAYEDNDFINAFKGYRRESNMVDQIPFMIYYKGMTPEVVDVNGCNSLDMTPTLLDYLDMTSQNFFLGESLFSLGATDNQFEYLFNEELIFFSTKDAEIKNLTKKQEKRMHAVIKKYYEAKMHEVVFE